MIPPDPAAPEPAVRSALSFQFVSPHSPIQFSEIVLYVVKVTLRKGDGFSNFYSLALSVYIFPPHLDGVLSVPPDLVDPGGGLLHAVLQQ